jgi:hypothetical protein
MTEHATDDLVLFMDREPGTPMLKAVQAAVALRGEAVDVKLPRGGWEVRYSLGQLRPELLDALKQRLDAEGGLEAAPALLDFESRALEHLVFAFELLKARPPHRAELRLHSRSHSLWVEVDAKGALRSELLETNNSDFGGQFLVEMHHFSLWEIFKFDRGYHESLHRCLVERLALCPIPVSLEGHVISPACLQTLPEYPATRSAEVAPRVGEQRHYLSFIERWWLEPDAGQPRFAVTSPRLCGARLASLPLETCADVELDIAHSGTAQSAVLELLSHALFREHQATAEKVQDRWSVSADDLPARAPDAELELLRWGVPKLSGAPDTGSYPDVWLETPLGARVARPLAESTQEGSELLIQTGQKSHFDSRSAELHGFFVGRMLCLPALPTGHSYLYAVIDGALTNPVALEICQPGVVGIVTGAGLKTGRNQLDLVADAELESTRASLLEQAAPMLEVARAWLHPEAVERFLLPEKVKTSLEEALYTP